LRRRASGRAVRRPPCIPLRPTDRPVAAPSAGHRYRRPPGRATQVTPPRDGGTSEGRSAPSGLVRLMSSNRWRFISSSVGRPVATAFREADRALRTADTTPSSSALVTRTRPVGPLDAHHGDGILAAGSCR
jgi:hypothetical protein